MYRYKIKIFKKPLKTSTMIYNISKFLKNKLFEDAKGIEHMATLSEARASIGICNFCKTEVAKGKI